MNRSTYLLLGFISAVSFGHSQTGEAEYGMRKTYVNLELSSQLCGRIIDAPAGMEYLPGTYYVNWTYAGMIQEYLAYETKDTRPGVGYSAHLNLSHRLGASDLRIKYGFGLESFRLKTTKMKVYSISNDPVTGQQHTNPSSHAAKWQYNFHYARISIPVSFDYYFRSSKRIFYHFGAGINLAICYQAKKTGDFGFDFNAPDTVRKNNSAFIDREDEMSSFFLQAQGGICIHTAAKSFVAFDPFIKYDLIYNADRRNTTGTRRRLYAIGFAVSYNF